MTAQNLLTVIGVVALFAGPVGLYQSSTPSAQGTTPATPNPNQLGFLSHINHIVYVILENHAYDNYLGTYCLVKSTLCPTVAAGLPAGTCVPYNASVIGGPCIRPWNYTAQNWTLKTPLSHSWNVSHMAWNNGSMNGFYAAEKSGLDPFGHYNGTTAPIYWDLAQEYAMSDNFYSSILSYSLPNHWHMVAGQSPQVVVINGTLGSPTNSANGTIRNDRTYLNQSNHTRSIEDLLVNSTVSWTYYDYALGKYANAVKIFLNPARNRILSTGGAYNPWNPQAAKAESYNTSFVQHFAVNSQFYSDARNGTLPNVSWVIPSPIASDHAGRNSTAAQSWLASIVNAVQASPEWNSTAVYVTWDDYGGFYDGAVPPKFAGQQLAFRVPLMVISPYTRAGAVAHSMGFFESVLHLIEWRFHLGCIATLDCTAPLPIYGFDWSHGPRAPLMFPTNFSKASYPFDPAWNGTAAVRIGAYVPPSQFTNSPDGGRNTID
jgi:phospholipase C